MRSTVGDSAGVERAGRVNSPDQQGFRLGVLQGIMAGTGNEVPLAERAVQTMSKAVYPGTFDPPHKGHLDLIQRGSRMFDELIVAVAVNRQKSALFTPEERVEWLKVCTEGIPGVRIQAFDGLVVDLLERESRRILLRGTIEDESRSLLGVPGASPLSVGSVSVREPGFRFSEPSEISDMDMADIPSVRRGKGNSSGRVAPAPSSGVPTITAAFHLSDDSQSETSVSEEGVRGAEPTLDAGFVMSDSSDD